MSDSCAQDLTSTCSLLQFLDALCSKVVWVWVFIAGALMFDLLHSTVNGKQALLLHRVLVIHAVHL